MPVFAYEAMNNVGQPVKDTVEAANSEEAIAKVRAMGYFPTKIKEKAVRKVATGGAGAGGGAGARRKSVGKVSRKQLTTFTRQLSTLIDAGLPILRSLRILEQQLKPGMMRIAVRLVATDVEGGSTLSEAMGRHPKAFDRLYVNMVRAGELGGVLDVILQRLADFMEQSEALKRKIKGAMIYPIVVITFAILIVTGIMIVVVPNFQDIFSDMGEKLPAPTRMLLGFSAWMKDDFGWLVLLSIPLGIWATLKLLKFSNGGRYLVDRMKISFPIMGQIVSKTAIARFTRTLGTLLSAGVPILEAIQITKETAGNELYSRALTKVHDGIREGETFADPLRQSRVVDPMVVNMIDVGEETGELDKMLNKVADNYDDEVDTLVSSMVSLLEPVMVVVLGGIVGAIVVSLFMPMVSLIDAVSK
jgi:type IV pilus assembly protein PilC